MELENLRYFERKKSIFSLLFLSTPASSVMGQISRQLQFNSLSLLNTHTNTHKHTLYLSSMVVSPSLTLFLSIFISFLPLSLICLYVMFSRLNLLLYFSNSLLFFFSVLSFSLLPVVFLFPSLFM